MKGHAQPARAVRRPRDVPVFVLLWCITVFANLGTQIQSVAAGWLMTDLGSSGQVALIQSFIALPLMIFALPAGVLADLFDKWAIMTLAYGLMLAAALLAAIMGFAHAMQPLALLSLCALFGTGQALFGPTSMAAAGDVLPRPMLAAGVAALSVAFNLSRCLGPAIGGALVAISGPAWTFAFNALSCGAIVVVLLRRRRARPAQGTMSSGPGFRRLLVEGVQFGIHDRIMRNIILRMFAFTACASPVWALLPLIVRRQLGGTAMVYGLIVSAMGIGALVISLSIARLVSSVRRETIARTGSLAVAVTLLTLPLAHHWVLVAVQLFVAGASWVASLTVFNIAVQANAGFRLAGRAMGLFYAAIFGGLAIGSAFFGQLVQRQSLPVALTVSGILVLVSLVAGIRWATPDVIVSSTLRPAEKGSVP